MDESKPDRKRDMTEGLLRQRRNLLATSLVIIFVYAWNASISEINILGNKILIKSQIAVHISLWVFFLYFLYRYWLYFLEEPLNRFEIEYQENIDKYFSPLIRKIAIKQNNQNHPPNVLAELANSRFFSTIKSGNYQRLTLFRVETYGARTNNSSPSDINQNLRISGKYFRFRYLYLHLPVAAKMAFKDSRFSDYLLPFFVALAAVVVGCIRACIHLFT